MLRLENLNVPLIGQTRLDQVCDRFAHANGYWGLALLFCFVSIYFVSIDSAIVLQLLKEDLSLRKVVDADEKIESMPRGIVE